MNKHLLISFINFLIYVIISLPIHYKAMCVCVWFCVCVCIVCKCKLLEERSTHLDTSHFSFDVIQM